MTITVSIHVFTNHIFISNNKTKLNFASSNNIYIWFPVSVVKRKRRYYLKMPKVNNINHIVFRILKSSFELVKKKTRFTIQGYFLTICHKPIKSAICSNYQYKR